MKRWSAVVIGFVALTCCGGEETPVEREGGPAPVDRGEAASDEQARAGYRPPAGTPPRKRRPPREAPRHDSLLDAVRYGSVDDARYHLERGASVDVRSSEERSLVHLAVDWGKPELVRLLIKHGAPVNAQDANGASPLHYAVQTLDSGTVRLLLQEGADPNVTDDDGHTPLDYAIGFADADCIRALRAHGAEARTELKGGPPPGSVPLPTQ